VLGLTAALALLALGIASTHGAYAISPAQLLQVIAQAVTGAEPAGSGHLVFMHIRLPRLVLGAAAGAGLALAGALMQGLFRNPLADPGLVGVSSGAALAAAAAIVLGGLWWPSLPRALGSWPLVGTAFAGGLAVTAMIYALAQSPGGTRVGLMLLAGVAVNALAGAGLGYLSFISTDEQLRNLQMWLMGSLGGARWGMASLAAGACWLARPLNALALGEAQARLLGVPVERTKRLAIGVAALAVGAVTAATGVIGFIGLVAPHGVRLLAGPDHRVVLPASALRGAALVLLADTVARTAVKPAELLFLFMLRQFKGRV
jgi:iron complex transport system permease protein